MGKGEKPKGGDTGPPPIIIPGGEEGEWMLVRRPKGKGRGGSTSASGEATGRPGRALGEASGRPTVTPEQRETWRKNRRCVGCGSKSHYVRKCPTNPSDNKKAHGAGRGKPTPETSGAPNVNQGRKARPTRSGEAQKTTKGAGEPISGTGRSPRPTPVTVEAGTKRSRATASTPHTTTAAKRARDQTPSGHTPPAKKTFSYASATAGAMEFAIVNADMGHVRRPLYEALRTSVEKAVITELLEGKATILIDQWSYNRELATVHVADLTTAETLKRLATAEGCRLLTRAQLAEVRKPTTILSGLLTGPAASGRKETLDLYVKAEKHRRGIPGRMEVCQTFETKAGNLVLKLLVDEEALTRVRELDMNLRIGGTGLVHFTDLTEDKKLNNAAARQAALEAKRKELREKEDALRKAALELREAEREAEEALETDSEVGSLGASSMAISGATDAQMETIEEEIPELPGDADETARTDPPVRREEGEKP